MSAVQQSVHFETLPMLGQTCLLMAYHVCRLLRLDPHSCTVQGLAEVLSVMGDAHLSELLPELAASATSKNPFVREGHLTLFR